MDKVVFDLQENTGVPVSNLKEFKILETSSWSRGYLSERPYYKKFCVQAAYTICTGDHLDVYTSDSKADCIRFIKQLYL